MPTSPATAAAVAGVVAGEHPHLQAERLQLRDRLGGLGLDGVGDRDQPGQRAVDGDVQRGAAAGRGPVGRGAASAAVSMPWAAIRCAVADQRAGRRRPWR